MPTYEYVCTSCQNAWEEIQKISEDPLKICPKCGKDTAKRQISGGNFILKGGGWYADLYSSSPKGKSGGDGDKGKSEGASAAKSETKTETKSEAPKKADSGGGSSSSGGGGGGSSGGGSSSSSSSS